jgi:hypothetical protein
LHYTAMENTTEWQLIATGCWNAICRCHYTVRPVSISEAWDIGQ